MTKNSTGKTGQPVGTMPASTDEAPGANPMWGGRFGAAPASIMEEINASIHFDRRLYKEDIAGSLAHAEMLETVGVLTEEDGQAVRKGLATIQGEIEAGNFSFDPALEDIHMNIESRLRELIGDAAGRLHTARSRNDQVATDFRLWVRGAIDRTTDEIVALQRALIDQADSHVASVMPGFTHLQSAQPVTLGHHLLAYTEMLGRDRGRFADCRARLNESPLGAAALAGTSFPIDRDQTAKALGFDRPTANSLDTVSDRDFALEALAAASLCASHLSRLGEELVIWSSAQFRFIRLSDGYSTGSSIMPQKRNPDAAELMRGKTGRITGALVALLTTMKGLSLAYAKDMQEDKEPVFDAFDSLSLCLRAAAGMIGDMTVNEDAMRAAAGNGHATATELADWLVRNLNMPFRDAHHVTAEVVQLADDQGCQLWDLKLADMQAIASGITEDARAALDPGRAASARNSYGGTAPEQVRVQVQRARERFL
jgi:argininosuccinate lyase